MTDEELARRIEASFERDDEELREELPDLLDDIEGQSEELVREHPELVSGILARMQGMDIAEFVSENPQTADQFQELLWTGVQVLAENNPEVRERIGDDISVDFEANDCPMEGHLEVDREDQTITGGPGRLDDPDLVITGAADTLVGLITGELDPIQGFMQQRYQMDGPIQKGTRLAPIMNSLAQTASQ